MKTHYKGTDKNLKCQDLQYEVGKEYTHKGGIELCKSGFHSCENPLDVLHFYSPCDSRFLEVVPDGEQKNDNHKTVSSRIKIKNEISFSALIKAGIDFLLKHTKTTIAQEDGGHAAAQEDGGHAVAQGDGGHAAAQDGGHAAAQGDGGHAAVQGNGGHAAAQGDKGHAAAQGDWGHAVVQGDGGHAAAQGDGGHAAAQGECGHAVAQGKWGHAATQGKESIAAALGIYGKAQSKQGWIVIIDWRWISKGEWVIKDIHHAKVGGKIMGVKIKPDTAYWFEKGLLKEGYLYEH